VSINNDCVVKGCLNKANHNVRVQVNGSPLRWSTVKLCEEHWDVINGKSEPFSMGCSISEERKTNA